jgi:geranylgeranyl diphosphate synthase, type II
LNKPFESILTNYRQKIQERILAALQKKDPATLYNSMRYAVSASGKMIRPILLLLSCRAVNGADEEALDAAVALEMIHTFTLVHDDIMDHDDLRRGRETVYKKWDENVAILAGDGLLVLAYRLLANVDPGRLPVILRLFSHSILLVCEGQALDKEFENRTRVSVCEYFEMIEKKTGQLFSLAGESGAVLGGGSPQQIEALRGFGESLGRAFQLQDDLLDLLADEATLGKDVGSDLQENKKTYLIACAQEKGSPEQLHQLHNLMDLRPMRQREIAAISALLSEMGVLDNARDQVQQALNSARSALEILPQTTARDHLLCLLEILAVRNR